MRFRGPALSSLAALVLVSAQWGCGSGASPSTHTTIAPDVQPTADTVSPPADTAQPTADAAQPTADTAQPTADTASPTADTAQPTADTAQPTADTAQPMADTAQPMADTAQPTADTATVPDTYTPPIVCPKVPKPALPAADPLPSLKPVPKTSTTKGKFTDDWLINTKANIRIATRRQWGASIVFFGQSSAGSNVIDANDTGREVQVALYDITRIKQGCAWNATCAKPGAKTCANSITYLGWNPVQGGNECNIGSGVEAVSHNNGELIASVRPLFWNPDWQAKNCVNTGCFNASKKVLKSDVRYRQRLRFVHPNIVEIQMEVQNLAAINHPVTAHELPTVYAAFGKYGLGNYRRLFDSQGKEIKIDQPANDGFFHKGFASYGGWATLQNAKTDYGVGLYYENRHAAFSGWQKAGVFNNFRANVPFAIPANGTVRARAYLMLGGLGTVKSLAAWLDKKLPPFGSLDLPKPDAKPTGKVVVAGWALDNKQVTKLQLRIDGKAHAALSLNAKRPDVCAVWPGYGMCKGMVGYNKAVSLAKLTPCAHLLEVVATDADGNSRVIGRRRILAP